MSSRAKSLLKVALVLDALAFGGWIGQQEVLSRSGTEVRLPIEGYDPRDPLSGHYLRFRLLAEREAADLHVSEGEVGLCLAVGEGGLAHVEAERKGERAGCPLYLAARNRGWRVETGVDRFYISEAVSAEVATVGRGESSYLVARLDRLGHAHPLDLVVQGRSVRR